jgi:4-amino-4-deoxy-L-arabinose transferase-like glycosyltransferase
LLARDILEHGHWLLPRLNGIPHLNKPPLTAWLMTLTSWPMGTVQQWNAALPTLLAAVGVVLGTYWLARRLFDGEVAFMAGLVVLTTYGAFTLARAPMPDMLLCAAFTASMAVYAVAEFDGHRFAMIGFYCLIGVAFWTKGPAGFIPLVLAAVDQIATYGWSGLARLMPAQGLALLTSMTLPWWLLAGAAGRERFVQEVVLSDFVGWYVPTHGWSWHRVTEPVGQAFTILLPWSPLVLAATWWAMRAPGDPGPARRVRWLVTWLGVVLAVIGVSDQQRMRYYLPLCPAAAILVAWWWTNTRLPHRRVVFAGTWALAALGLSLWQVHVDTRSNAATDLGEILRQVRNAPMPLYTVKSPDLVFGFYLEQSITTLPSYDHFEREVENGYLIVRERELPSRRALPVRHVATARVHGRRYLLLAKGPAAATGLVDPD